MPTTRRFHTPLGAMHALAAGGKVLALRFGDAPEDGPPCAALAALGRQLDDYFARRRAAFDVPLALEGTPFQRRVWDELLRIEHGQTITYGELARRIGEPRAPRAVGAANGRNPVAIVVPCHRVVAAGGRLGGYSGGGPDVKRFLLEHEASAGATLA